MLTTFVYCVPAEHCYQTRTSFHCCLNLAIGRPSFSQRSYYTIHLYIYIYIEREREYCFYIFHRHFSTQPDKCEQDEKREQILRSDYESIWSDYESTHATHPTRTCSIVCANRLESAYLFQIPHCVHAFRRNEGYTDRSTRIFIDQIN